MAVIQCPECHKSLKVSDASAGKRVRCPACKKPFVVPDAAVELEEVVAADEEPEKRVTKRPRRDPEDRVAKRPRRDSEEEERPRRPKRRRPRDDDDDDIVPSSAPLVYGILACCLSCAPLIGFILGRLAMSKAEQEMSRLPGGKHYRDARKRLQLAKTLGVVGMGLSGFFLLLAIVLRIVG
ncbi:MAG TPA: MJ0042-type zinc finger domain-containing protein [Gemmataceae bacterium]|nr:MJ0042-type zinc finger domain-containing protein [Gemmataceae bacterium]